MITERDRTVLTLVQRFRLLSRDQIRMAAGFGSKTRVNARLAHLVSQGLLDRRYLSVRPGHGGAEALYFLGRSKRTLTELAAHDLIRDHRQIRRWEPQYAAHLLAANQVLVTWLAACETSTTVRAVEYRTEIELRRQFAETDLVPDGWLAWQEAGRRFNVFVEVDLHHEGLTAWRRKALAYLRYLESGAHAERFGFRSCRVLVLANTDRRLVRLKQIATIGRRLFLFAPFQSVSVATFFEPIWARAEEDVRVSLAAA